MKHELRDTAGIANCLGVVTLVASAQRRPERTAWMLGATHALNEQFGTPWMGVEAMEAVAEQAAQGARAALGGDRYDQVIREVRSRSIDEIVDMTVSDLDTMPALPSAGR